MITEISYDGYDNTIDLLLKAGASEDALTAQDLSAVTRMVLTDDANIDIDSDVEDGAFDWDTGTTGKVIIAIGDQSIADGSYEVKLIVYDPSNTNGIVWDTFILKVE